MSAGTPAATPSAALTDRARRQRRRILEASMACFVERGFHAASMAAIAERAGMSPSLIYRYFTGKGDIVRAIIDLQLGRSGAILDQLDSAGDLVAAIAGAFSQWCQPGCEGLSATLFLEMTAEATRDPEVAALTRTADREIRGRVEEALRRSMTAAGATPDDATVRRRALMLLCLVHGLAVRAVREPDLEPDVLAAGLEEVVAALVRG